MKVEDVIEITHSHVMRGTLLVVTSDGRTFEIQRIGGNTIVATGDDGATHTDEEGDQFERMYFESEASSF